MKTAAVKAAWQHPRFSRLSGQSTLAHQHRDAAKITSINHPGDNTFFFFFPDDCVLLDFHARSCWLNGNHQCSVIKWPEKQQKTMFHLFDRVYSGATWAATVWGRRKPGYREQIGLARGSCSQKEIGWGTTGRKGVLAGWWKYRDWGEFS